jgi:CBS domain-containing protein
VPVLDDEGRLAGIVTRADIIRGAISPQRRA